MRIVSTFSAMILVCCGLLSTQSAQRRGLDELSRPGSTLRSAVLAAGGNFRTIELADGGWLQAPDFASLAKGSEIVVVGRTRGSVCKLSSDQRSVVTVFQVVVEGVLKGSSKSQIEVTVPGGRYTFDDAGTAEVIAAKLRPIEIGQRYLFFLSAAPHVPTGLAQGVFEIRRDGTLVQNLKRNYAEPKLDGHPLDEIVAEVRAVSVSE